MVVSGGKGEARKKMQKKGEWHSLQKSGKRKKSLTPSRREEPQNRWQRGTSPRKNGDDIQEVLGEG